jgi:hypothetical protein
MVVTLMISVSIMAIIVLVCALTMLTFNTQQTFAMIGGQSVGSSGTNGSTSGVDRHLFCNTGVITPACK